MGFLLNVVVLLLLLTSVTQSAESLVFSAAALKIGAAQLRNIRLSIDSISQPAHTFSMQAGQLSLPEPFNTFKFANLSCTQLNWDAQLFKCRNGHVEIKAQDFSLTATDFSFSLTPSDSVLRLGKIKFAGGELSLLASEIKGVWQAELQSKSLNLAKLQPLLKKFGLSIKSGSTTFVLKLAGQRLQLQAVNAKISTADLAMESQSGFMAAEKLQLETYLTAQLQEQNWIWQNHTRMLQGGLYLDPVYLTTQTDAIEFDSLGSWQVGSKVWQVDYAQWLHPNVGNLNAYGTISTAASFLLPEAAIDLTALDLKQLGTLYLNPFILGTAFEGLSLGGKLNTQFTLKQAKLDALKVDAQQLQLNDPKHRFGLQNVNADFEWSHDKSRTKAGRLSWQQMLMYALPLGAAKFDLQISADQIRLGHAVTIDFLGGKFAVQDFSWQSHKQQDPELHFSAALNEVSLDQLTTALKWTPLSGKVSGNIPGVRYQKNRLDLDGAITIQVFDGSVTLENLAVANLLSDVPKFYSDIEIEKLNLKQVTDKFQFGGIQGLLSGYINDLYLENWKPISFYAWLGTPKNDSTSHRISQKAVDNIANIGGNGATDMISKGIMGMFDSFGYSELGMGCYLHHGVCQLMGVQAAANGYYLIKGGGLPRIDVVGYNPKVDWKVLVQRLGRLNDTNNMVVE